MPEDRGKEDYVDTLRGVPRIAHDEDDRPSREDRQPGRWQQLFNFPVKLPRWLAPRRRDDR